MALRFYYEFQNHKEEVYRVEIHDEQHASSSTEITATGEGFTLAYDGNDDELFQPIMGSKCTLEFLNRESYESEMNDFLDDLLTRDEADITVAIYYDPDDTNTLYWAGVVFTDQTEVEEVPIPYQVTLTAGDDLAALKAIEYNDDGTAYTGNDSLLDHALKCLNKTRTTSFWSASDIFIAWGKYFEYASAGFTADPVQEDVGFFHEEFYDTDVPGVFNYYTCYQMLEAICSAFMLTLMQVDGKWVFCPRHKFWNLILINYDTYEKDGDSIATNQTNISTFKTIDTTAGNPLILAGWEENYLNPVRAVYREYEFRGNFPIITGDWDETNFGTLTETASTYIVPSGGQLTFYGQFKAVHTANTGRTGNAQVLRYKLSIQLKVGTYYLKRVASQLGTSNTIFLDGDPFDVFNTILGSASWTTNSADRFEIYSSYVIATEDDTTSFFIPITTPGLPADSAEVEVTCDVEAYEADGTTSGTITSDAFDDAVVTVQDLKLWVSDGNSDSLDAILYNASSDNNAYDVYELPEAIIGDQISNVATRGSLRRVDNNEYLDAEWDRNGVSLNLEVVQLLCRQQMSQRKEVTILQNGTLYATKLHPHYVFLYQAGRRYVPYRFSFRANSAEYDVELFRVQENDSGITVAEGDRFDTDGISNTTDGNGSGVAIQGAALELMDRSLSGVGGQLNALYPATATGPRLRAAVGDANYVELQARSGLSSSETITIPSALSVFLVAAGRINAASTEYFMPLASGGAAASLQYTSESLMPQACDIGRVAFRVIQTPGATTIRVYKNGSVEDSLTPATVNAGTAYNLSFTASFDVGDRLAVSVETANTLIDVQINVQLILK